MIKCSKLAKIAKREKQIALIGSVVAYLSAVSGYDLGYVLGVLLGDGMICHAKAGGVATRLEVISETFAEKFYSTLLKVVPPGTNVQIGKYTQLKKAACVRNPEYTSFTKERLLTTWIVRCHNPGVAQFFEGLILKFKSGEAFGSLETRGILDGLFDSEACFKKERYGCGYRFSFHMIDHVVIDLVREMLSGLEVPSCSFTSKTGYSKCLSVGKRSDLKRLCSIVRFSVQDKESIRNEILGRA